jgi:hypothetical protein
MSLLRYLGDYIAYVFYRELATIRVLVLNDRRDHHQQWYGRNLLAS